jgi:hypothetical protein
VLLPPLWALVHAYIEITSTEESWARPGASGCLGASAGGDLYGYGRDSQRTSIAHILPRLLYFLGLALPGAPEVRSSEPKFTARGARHAPPSLSLGHVHARPGLGEAPRAGEFRVRNCDGAD